MTCDALQAAQGGSIQLTIVRGTDERTIDVPLAPDRQPGQEA